MINLEGHKFGRLTVLEDDGARLRGYVHWPCTCECGNFVRVVTSSLTHKSNPTISCGCFGREQVLKKLVKEERGNRYGRLTVIGNPVSERPYGLRWLCRCDCGEELYVFGYVLRRGTTRSCGCLKVDSKLGENNPNWKGEDAKYPQNRLYRETFKQAVLEKHGIFCVHCGDEYENLHHLDGWNVSPLKRFLVDNVVPLCYGCHSDFHDRYGRGSNTLAQFLEYMTLPQEAHADE